MPTMPDTRYARTAGGVHIACQVLGDGPIDMVYVPGFVSHLELGWEWPSIAHSYRSLAAIGSGESCSVITIGPFELS